MAKHRRPRRQYVRPALAATGRAARSGIRAARLAAPLVRALALVTLALVWASLLLSVLALSLVTPRGAELRGLLRRDGTVPSLLRAALPSAPVPVPVPVPDEDEDEDEDDPWPPTDNTWRDTPGQRAIRGLRGNPVAA